MTRTGRLALVLCVFPIVGVAQEDPRTWFPLKAGSRWIYAYEWKSGNRNAPDIDRWTAEKSITASVAIPEGIVVLRDVTELGNTGEPIVTTRVILPNGQIGVIGDPGNRLKHARMDARDRDPYLIHANCIYVISGGWDGQKQQLRPQYRQNLNEGAVSPDFCFPLQAGASWGNNDIPWRVEPAPEAVRSLLPETYAGAIHIFTDHFGSGGWMDVWFQKGTGVVAEHYIHDGTYDEFTKTLLSFSP